MMLAAARVATLRVGVSHTLAHPVQGLIHLAKNLTRRCSTVPVLFPSKLGNGRPLCGPNSVQVASMSRARPQSDTLSDGWLLLCVE